MFKILLILALIVFVLAVFVPSFRRSLVKSAGEFGENIGDAFDFGDDD